jgi:hypothetical protein
VKRDAASTAAQHRLDCGLIGFCQHEREQQREQAQSSHSADTADSFDCGDISRGSCGV